MIRRSLLALVAIAAIVIPAAASTAPASNSSTNSTSNTDVEQVTWADHVAPLLYGKCVTCHRPGQVAPMSLMTYQDARPWAKSIRKATATRTMPPWFANPAHGDFAGNPSLTDQEIALLEKWVEAGAPSGDLAKAPEAPTFDSEWKIGKPDVIFTMEPFQVTDEMEDHYQWLKIENTLDRDRWIKAIEVRPSFLEAAHHNLTYIGKPGMAIDAIEGAGRLDLDYVGGWAPGVMPMTYPDGYGKRLPANSTIFFQMHYHKTPGEGTGGIDQTSVALKLYDGEVDNKVATMWVLDPTFNIPAGDANYASTSEWTIEHDAMVFNFTPHMHLRGKAMRYTAYYPDGTEEILLDVNNYDFNWQLTYSPREPKILPAGTRLKVDAVFDNSADNAANPDPSINVTWGEKTTDEMMIGFLDYTYVDQAQQVDMPTQAVPEAIKERFEQFRKLRKAQEKAAAESKSSDK